MNKNDIINIIKKRSSNLSWMEQNTCFITKHGSRAYNCHTESSDDDYKGFCIQPKSYLFGNLNKFDNVILKDPDPDCAIFEIKKFFSLAVQANPNILEMLFTDPEDHLFVSNVGEIVLDNRDLFISKKIYHTMNGYAFQQMKRMKNHRSWLLDPPKEAPNRKDFGLNDKGELSKEEFDSIKSSIKSKLDKFDFNFLDQLTNDQRIGIKEITADILAEMKLSSDDLWLGAARSIGLNDQIIELLKKEKSYETAKNHWEAYLSWKKNRNPKRFADEQKYGFDLKFSYHVARLFIQCEEVLSTGKLIVKRPDREFFMDIRNGKWTFDELMEFAEKKSLICKELYDNSKAIPHIPDQKKIDNLLISILEEFYNEK